MEKCNVGFVDILSDLEALPVLDLYDDAEYYTIPESNQILELSPPVLHRFKTCRQVDSGSEVGGLLFAEFCWPVIRISEATLPCRTKKELIYQRFDLGLHFVGEWHTHLQHYPVPSTLDVNSMHDSFVQSKHELNAFVMIIVGSLKSELSLWISLHNRMGFSILSRLDLVSQHTQLDSINWPGG